MQSCECVKVELILVCQESLLLSALKCKRARKRDRQPQGAFSALTSHFAFFDIFSQDSRQSLCTNLMLPEHLQGWNRGRPSSSSHLQILQTAS